VVRYKDIQEISKDKACEIIIEHRKNDIFLLLVAGLQAITTKAGFCGNMSWIWI